MALSHFMKFVNNMFKHEPALGGPDGLRQQTAQLDKEKLKQELKDSRVTAKVQIKHAKENITKARADALAAIEMGNVNGKKIACREIKLNLAIYRYMQGILSCIDVMESNMAMSDITANFATIVDRISRLQVPNETMDFGALTNRALKGLRAPSLNGLNDMVNQLMGATLGEDGNETDDKWIEAFLANPQMSIDEIQAPVLSHAVATAPAAVEETAAEETEDVDMQALMDMLSSMSGK